MKISRPLYYVVRRKRKKRNAAASTPASTTARVVPFREKGAFVLSYSYDDVRAYEWQEGAGDPDVDSVCF